MKTPPNRGKGATFFSMWLCFSGILAFTETIIYTTADPAWPPVKASYPQTECLLPGFYISIPFFFLLIVNAITVQHVIWTSGRVC